MCNSTQSPFKKTQPRVGAALHHVLQRERQIKSAADLRKSSGRWTLHSRLCTSRRNVPLPRQLPHGCGQTRECAVEKSHGYRERRQATCTLAHPSSPADRESRVCRAYPLEECPTHPEELRAPSRNWSGMRRLATTLNLRVTWGYPTALLHRIRFLSRAAKCRRQRVGELRMERAYQDALARLLVQDPTRTCRDCQERRCST